MITEIVMPKMGESINEDYFRVEKEGWRYY